jgi:GT2 family glycosyltransferase
VKRPKIAVIVLTYNGKDNLKDCFTSLKKQTYPDLALYFFDQNSEDGSYEYMREYFPDVTSTQFPVNSGFAKGNNDGMAKAFSEGADLCLLLNDDTEAEPEMVEELYNSYVRAKKSGKRVGLIQPTILLFDQRNKINTVGNAIHYLGFGYCKDFQKDHPVLKADAEIASASGAALLIPKEYYDTIGGLDEDFFMYNEDQNLSWRGMLKGYTHFVSSRAILYHKYNFHRRPLKVYHSEKNRLMILFQNYSAKTLILILPVLLLNEMIAVLYSPFGGYFRKKMESYRYVLTHLGNIRKNRKKIQSQRSIPDKEILAKFEAELSFEVMKNPLLKYLINPVYRVYYRLLTAIV